MTDMDGDRSVINTVPVNSSAVKGELIDISSIGAFQGVVRESESFNVIGCSTGPTFNYWQDVAYDDYLYETSWLLQSLTAGVVEANEGNLSDGMCCGCGDGWRRVRCTLHKCGRC